MIAKVNAPAVMPKLADPEAIPVIPIAAAIPTELIGEQINTANALPIKTPIKIGCKSVNVLIPAPIKAVTALTYGKTNKPKLPPITITMIGSNKIV